MHLYLSFAYSAPFLFLFPLFLFPLFVNCRPFAKKLSLFMPSVGVRAANLKELLDGLRVVNSSQPHDCITFVRELHNIVNCKDIIIEFTAVEKGVAMDMTINVRDCDIEDPYLHELLHLFA